MTLYSFGYVAMSMHLKNASPSKTMTFAQFAKIADKDAAIRKLERIANQNLANCLRLLRHNAAHQIRFFRLSSKLIPLANHPETSGWDFITPLKQQLDEIRVFLDEHPYLRVDFHPDHFVLLNTKEKDVFKVSLKVLQMHHDLLTGMGIEPTHRCVLHVGGSYNDKELALERFIQNWGLIPVHLQRMIILENDDTSFNVEDTLYLCEKLDIPLVFDYHHHLVNHPGTDLQEVWQRIVETWSRSTLPVKVHISSPRAGTNPRAHADYIDLEMFWDFVERTDGSTDRIDVMIEAKRKDEALFVLMKKIASTKQVEWENETSFTPVGSR